MKYALPRTLICTLAQLGLTALLLLALSGTPILAADATQADSPADGESPLSESFLAEYERLNEADGTTDEESQIDGSNGGSLAARLLFSLLLIVGLIYASLWIYRKALAGRTANGGSPPPSTLLALQESQSLGPNQKLHLVRMGEDVLLLGATEHSISFLARYGGDPDESSFSGQLKRAQTEVSSVSVPLEESLEQMRRIQPWRSSGDD